MLVVPQELWREAQQPINDVWKWAERLKAAEDKHAEVTSLLRADNQALLSKHTLLQQEFQRIKLQNAYLKRKLGTLPAPA